MINIDKLYDLMADRGFQEPRTGDLFFPAYIYTYAPEQEYEMRAQIQLLSEKLKRPNHYLDTLIINIYDEIITYLKAESFSGKTIFDMLIEKEKEDSEEAFLWVREEINGGGFYDYFNAKVKEHFSDTKKKRVYLLISGFGSAFPYIRASEFLKKTESLIKEFKIILFYPGEYNESKYSLFKILNDDNMYRANHLNRQFEEN